MVECPLSHLNVTSCFSLFVGVSLSSLLKLRCDFFSSGFLKASENLEYQYDPKGCELTNGRGEDLTAGLSASQMVTTALEWQKVDAAASEIPDLDPDPLKSCFICADASREVLNNGTTLSFFANVLFFLKYIS